MFSTPHPQKNPKPPKTFPPRPPPPPEHPAEEVVDDVLDAEPRKIAEPAEALPRGPRVPEPVVLLPLFGVGEDRVRFVDLLEPLLRPLVSGVAVRVVLEGELAERLLDVVGRALPGNSEDLVVIALPFHLFLPSLL